MRQFGKSADYEAFQGVKVEAYELDVRSTGREAERATLRFVSVSVPREETGCIRVSAPREPDDQTSKGYIMTKH
jgi:hypothetical protein